MEKKYIKIKISFKTIAWLLQLYNKSKLFNNKQITTNLQEANIIINGT